MKVIKVILVALVLCQSESSFANRLTSMGLDGGGGFGSSAPVTRNDGGRCPACGLMTMKGGSHICRPERLEQKRQKSENMVRKELALKYDLNPIELQPCVEKSKRFVITKTMREWKDSKGKTVCASFTHISEDEERVYLTLQSGKYIAIGLASLADADRKYVRDTVGREKNAGKKWCLGVYMDEAQIRRIDYENKALELIKGKDRLAQSFNGVQILSAKKSGGYGSAVIMKGSEWYRHPDYSKEFFYMSPVRGIVTDGDFIGPKRFYWAGAFDYTLTTYWRNYWGETESRTSGKVTDCFTDDIQLAIRLVRETCKLYDDDDEMFKDGEKSSKPSSAIGSAEELSATGSGFVVTTNGYIVTNYHVIEGARRVEVVNFQKKKFAADVVMSDKETDLALLKIAGIHAALPFSRVKAPATGSEIFTIGFPRPRLQGYQPKITKGIISGNEGFDGDPKLLQIDAAIQPGNSGGPLMDSFCRVVGVVVATLKGGQNVNYAIKRSYVKSFLEANEECYSMLVIDTSKEQVPLSEVYERVRPGCVLINNYR